MAYKNAFWGIILLVVGSLFLLRNLDIIDFSWYAFWRLWPLFLLLWGVSILPLNGWIRLALSVLAIGITLWIAQRTGYLERRGFAWDQDHHWEYRLEPGDSTGLYWDDQDTTFSVEQTIREPWDPGIHSAILRLDAAAGEFILTDTSSDLMHFEKSGRLARYNVTSKRVGDKQVIDLALQNTRIRGNANNKVMLALHPDPVWDFDLDIGAADLDFDLSPYLLGEVKVDGGAASIDLRFGPRSERVNVDIDAGAASITLHIPREAGCSFDSETFLASRDLEGFDKISRGRYRTPGFDQAPVKFFVKADAAISSFEIKRYR
ncbi:MAG TPA: DUF5668 domain-containing protein [Bacteroidales bacterium]|nr:DUF5668 domain-containing protein [Bacteroidales bacterium]